MDKTFKVDKKRVIYSFLRWQVAMEIGLLLLHDNFHINQTIKDPQFWWLTVMIVVAGLLFDFWEIRGGKVKFMGSRMLDYTTLGTTALATAISYTNWSISDYNDFTLNSSGLAQISKTGISKFGMREASYDVANTQPTWGSGQEFSVSGRFADKAGTSEDPKLVVTHSAPQNSAPSASTSLQTEGQTNPTNITDTTPEFSAIYNDVDTTDTATHYRIQVST